MPKFRKKPVVVEAIRYLGQENCAEVHKFLGYTHYANGCLPTIMAPSIGIATLEGEMRANPGDWIIKGVKGEFYPCKPDIFEATYEEVESCSTHGG
jgi:hypothetical protein